MFRGERGRAYREVARWLGSGRAAVAPGIERVSVRADPGGGRAEGPLGPRHDRSPRARVRGRRPLPGRGLGAGCPGRAAAGRRARRGVLPPRPPRGARRRARRARPVPGGRLLARAARPSARASAPPARRRAASLGRRPLRRRAHPRRRHAVEVDSDRAAGCRCAREVRRASRPGALRPARGARPCRLAVPQGARNRSLLELRPHPRRRAALRRVVHLLPDGRSRARARRAQPRSRTSSCARGSSRRCSTVRPRSASTAATRLRTTARAWPPRRSGWSSSPARSEASAITSCGSTRTATWLMSRRRASPTTRRSGSTTRPASGPGSPTRSGPGTSSATSRATSSRSRSPRWT